MNPQLHFELLCFDLDNRCPFGADVNKFTSILNGNTKLFSSSASTTSNVIKDKNLQVTITLIEGNSSVDYKSAFLVNTSFNTFPDIEIDKFRIELVKYLVTLQFGKIYVSKDEFSRKLLNELYPKINELENLLRSYVTKHMSIKEGVAYWFARSTNNEAKNKVDKRKNRENIFSILSPKEETNIVDTKISLIDFEDLGEIVYSNSFGNQNISDLVEKILSSSDLENLKSSVQRNSDKYFQSFKEVDFQNRWGFLKDIRHKVAHNGYITYDEYTKAKDDTISLLEFITKLDKEIIDIEFNDFDIDRSLYNESSHLYKDISKNELLAELKSYKEWGDSIGRDFLGLKNFLYNRLGGSKGYHIGKAWDRLEELQIEGYIKIEIWKDPAKKFPDQKEILILRELPVWLV